MKELQLFDIYNSFIDDMNKSSSINEKLCVLQNCKQEIHNLLYYTYNPFFQYYITPKILKKRSDLCHWEFRSNDSIFNLLDLLRNREITGHKAISAVNFWLNNNENLRDIFYLILEKNLKIRASVKLINRAIPNLIPTFSVALAEKFDNKVIEKNKINFELENWYVSRKLDGVRCLVFIDEEGNIDIRSRSGKSINTLQNLSKEISKLNLKSFIIDGEICKVDNEGNENFQEIMKEIGRKNFQIENFKYYCFDLLRLEDFYAGVSNEIFSQRISNLKNLLLNAQLENVEYLPQGLVKSLEEFKLIQLKIPPEWEGLMLRKDNVYQGKRSRDIYKVKKFYDAEYTVIDLSFGPFRYIKEGVEIEENMLSSVYILHKGTKVSVGSGFSIDERKHYLEYPDNILNKTITVQYFEESQNQLGEYSLRFPVKKIIHQNKREY